MPPSKQVRALEALLHKHGLGETLRRPPPAPCPGVPSGIADLDSQLGGGLPRGSISEITGTGSSGRTGLVFRLLARATRSGELAAYIDATDCLDPRSAQEAGIVLPRLLWVRCGGSESAGSRHGDEAWRATNLAVSAGTFGIVAVDLGGLSQRQLGRWRRHPWKRLQHAVEGSPTALVVLAERPAAGSSAGLALKLQRQRTEWDGVLAGFELRIGIIRNRARALARPGTP